jgi:hypothetical protein
MQRVLVGKLFAVLATALVSTAAAGELTAFELVKEANRHVGQDCRDRVVQVRSDKSIGTLVPQTWYVVLYDPDAASKGVEVRFQAGQKVGVKRPARIFRSIIGTYRELPRAKLKVDSNKALEIALAEPILKNIKVKASALKLDRRSSDDETPVWEVELWAAKLDNPNQNVKIGEVLVAAEDGRVLERDLKISRVD